MLRIFNSKAKLVNIGIGMLLIISAAYFSMQVGYSQFGGYDLSPIIDLSWRFNQGQRPGVDYFNTLPIIFLVLIKLISGVSQEWGNLIVLNIYVTMAAYILLLYIAGLGRCTLAWTLAVALILSVPLIYTNHIWHSALTQITGICFFYTIYINSHATGVYVNLRMQIIIGLVSGLLFLSKQNLAPSLLFSFMVIFFLNFENKLVLLRSSVVGSLALLFISLLYLEMPLQYFIDSQMSVLGRAKPDAAMFESFRAVKSNWWLLAVAIFLIMVACHALKNTSLLNKNALVFSLSFLFMSFVPIFTDWDIKLNNSPLPLFILSTIVLHSNSLADRICLFGGLILVLLVSIWGGGVRERMRHVGTFYEEPNNITIHSGYFSNVKTGRLMAEVVAEMYVLKKNVPNENIFFGPRIEFGYVLTNSVSPKHLPLWWHPGTSYSLNVEDQVIKNFQQGEFKVIIFLKNDRTRMPDQIIKYVESGFTRKSEYKFIDVFIKNIE